MRDVKVYRIGEVAERTGFPVATLRYYEQMGLLHPTDRTPAGFRVYDYTSLARLGFIARAKQLGCSLDDISELLTAWDGGTCAPVQDRLREVVARSIARAQTQIAELTQLSADRAQSAADLERHRPAGPCDAECGCIAGATPGGVTGAVRFSGRRPTPQLATPDVPAAEAAPSQAPIPIACTLDQTTMSSRLAAWHDVAQSVVQREKRETGMRLTFSPDVAIARLADLVAVEQDCCRFFEFRITIDQRGIALEIEAPAEAQPIVTALFGAAA